MATVRADERSRSSEIGEPVWELAELYPRQGQWTESSYLHVAVDRRHTNRLMEFVDGRLEILSMPSTLHQRVSRFLFNLIYSFVDARRLGETFFPPYRVRLPDGRHREPDVLCVLKSHAEQIGPKFTQGADIVVEVVSDDDPDRDWVDKKADYAAAGVPEYWIADPRDQTLTILTLDAGAREYREAGRYAAGETARSVLLQGLSIDVTAAFTHD